MRDTSATRFRLHHDLDNFYHQLFDSLVEADIRESDKAHITQLLLNSRLDALKHLVSEEETVEYEQASPDD